jgi:cytoskeletal protein RodZ
MKRGFKFISRLVVGIALIILAGVLIWNLFNTIVIPKLPVTKGAEYVQDVSGSMSDPDKTYARNAIKSASKENKIAIVLDYQLTTFAITDSYLDKTVSSVVNNVYRNQKYVVYTYFADTDTLQISTNINDTANDVVNKTKEGIDTDARVVKEILYYQQNLKREYGLKNWNFNLNSAYMKNACIEGVGSIILLILGIGVLPTVAEGLRNPFRRKKREKSHSAQ